MRNLFISLRAILFFTIVLGVVYPFLIMGVGYMFFKPQATGSIVVVNNKTVGSSLIGQDMPSNLFQSRPSASNYNALASGGSNYSIANKEQQKLVKTRVNNLQEKYGRTKKIPEDLVFASGSGLDPDITLEAADYQAEYIARVNNLPIKLIYRLIKQQSKYRLFNTYTVNVLELNLDVLRQIGNHDAIQANVDKTFDRI
jgi:K+-transporting ATPase ATPase C chain